MANKNLWLPAVLVLVYLAFRMTDLLLIHPDYLFVQKGDELYRGTLAREFLRGTELPFSLFRPDQYSNGGWILAHIAAFIFSFAGDSAFALKLAPLVFSAATLLVFYLLLQRHANQETAVCFALLYTFSPPVFTRYTLAALGDHTEAVFFIALTAFILFEIIRLVPPSTLKDGILFLLLGIVAGIAVRFNYRYLLVLTATAVFLLWKHPGKLSFKHASFFLIAFGVCFSPWIARNLNSHFSGLHVQGAALWEHFDFKHVLKSVHSPRHFAGIQFFSSFVSSRWFGHPTWPSNLLYSALLTAPMILYGLWSLKLPKTAKDNRFPVSFFVLYLLLLMLAVQTSRFNALRYRVPAIPVFMILFAFYWNSLKRFPVPYLKSLRWGLLSALILLGLITNAAMYRTPAFGQALSETGYSYAHFAAPLSKKSGGDLEPYRNFLNQLEEKDRPSFLQGFRWPTK